MPNKTNLTIPIAIVFAGLLIAGAVIYNGNSAGGGQAGPLLDDNNPPTDTNVNIKAVSDSDYILGNPNAPVKIVEFSDLECPFCKRFHATLQQVMNEYGKDGRVAWVYRHLPLESIHPQARPLAEGSECVAELGGNDAFWEYADLVFGS